LVVALAGALAACQSAGPEEVLDVAPKLPAPAQETIGAGPVMIALLLPRNGPEPAATRARDAFEGAKLAIGDLGGGQVRATAYETSGDPANAKFMAEQAISAGARMIVGPLDAQAEAQVAQIPAKARPPVVTLAATGAGSGIFGFASGGVDSALEGVRAAISAGQSQVVLLVPQGFSAADTARLGAGIARLHGKLLGTVAYGGQSAAIAQALQAQKAIFAKATTAVILGSGTAPAAVAQALATSGVGGSITTLVGSSGWPRELYSAPVLDGALVALPDQESLKQIASRYAASAGRPLSLDAAYAYDAVAIAAGLVRLNGANAVTAKALTADSGFRGATGIFRLRADGSVERRHTIYRIEKGKLAVLQDAGEGF
jgi:hypothetical protein